MGKKKKIDTPEGMSRRQAKLAARAAERAALEGEPRPFAGLVAEPALIALQEFVPSGFAEVEVQGTPVTICTVLPGAVQALVRDDGVRLVAMQTTVRSNQQGKVLAAALEWVVNAAPGEQLASIVPGPEQKPLSEVLSADTKLDVTVSDDFNWWMGESEVPTVFAQQLQAVNETVMPSAHIAGDFAGDAWWVDAGAKGHIRWVRQDDEAPLLRALARIAARGELNVGEDSKFAGVFRTHGVVVPVFDVDPSVTPGEFAAPLAVVDALIAQELGNDVELSAEERRQLDNIKSRQVTIR